MADRGKSPKYRHQPNPQKQAKTAVVPEVAKRPKMPEVRGGPLVWRFSSADRNGPFSWSNLVDPTEYKRVLERLHMFETMTENDIRQGGSHPVPLSGCCKDARDRLAEIEQDDVDELYSFRITGAERVYCRFIGNIMYVTWWDPEHRIYPSALKHT